MTAARDPDTEPHSGFGPLAPIDVLLGQGDPLARQAFRERLDVDAEAMFAMAETVALVERCRDLRTEPSARFHCQMADVVRRAERRHGPDGGGHLGPWLGLLAAVLMLGLLWAFDPLAGWRAQTPDVGTLAPPRGEPLASEASDSPVVPDSRAVAWQSAVEQMRRRLGMEPSSYMASALEAGLESRPDELRCWLDPRNALVLMGLDHELRASAAVRQAALHAQGGLLAVDDRVQQLADAIAADLLSAPEPEAASLADVAMAVRALLAAGANGGLREQALHSGSARLVAQLPSCHGAGLVQVLAALVEVVAVLGEHRAAVEQHGNRLVAAVLDPDDEVWSRRLPELLGAHVPATTLAEAGRLLARLPGVNVDADRCRLVRQLLLGHLRSRLAAGESTPELVAGLLYGSADLLADDERFALEVQARRWKPVRLAPDFATVQQLVWSFEPGQTGFAAMQRELRQLAVCAVPASPLARAAFCLCLATNYAAFGGGLRALGATGS